MRSKDWHCRARLRRDRAGGSRHLRSTPAAAVPVFFTHVVLTETEIGTIINPDSLRRDPATFSDLYIVFEHMDMDLNKLGRDTKQSIGLDHVRWFMYEVSDGTCDLFEAS